MAQRSCCVPGCSMKLGGGLPLHRFPNPNNPAQIERFRTWVMKIGGDIFGEDNNFIHKNRKVCHKHFEAIYTFPNKKLSALAIPTLAIPENSTTVKSESASYSTVVDMEEDPLKTTEDPISNTRIIEDVPSPQTPEGISCPSPIMDVPPPAEEVTISCTSPIVDNSPPRPTLAQQAMYPGSDVFAALKHTYSKFEVSETPSYKFQVPETPFSKFQVSEKMNVAACNARDVYKENVFVSLSDYKCQQQQIRLLKRQVCALKKRCLSYKNRLAQASKPSAAFQKVTKNMTEPAKLFTKMQFTQTHKKPAGRRFSYEEKNFSLSLYKTSPQSYSFLAHCFTLPSRKTIKAMLAQEKLEPYLTLDKNVTLPSNKTLVQERLEPYLTLDKNSTSPAKLTLKDMLAKDNFEPYLTLEQNSNLPFKITLKDILAHKQLEPYLTLKKNSTSPSKTTCAKEKPEPHRTLKKKSPLTLPSKKALKGILAHKHLEPYLTFKKNATSPSKTTCAKEKPEPHRTLKKKSTLTLPSKKALKGILAQEKLEPYLTFNKNSTKTYSGKGKATTEAD